MPKLVLTKNIEIFGMAAMPLPCNGILLIRGNLPWVIQLDFFFFFFFIRPSYTNIRTPCRASNEGDLPPREGAQTRLW